MQMHVSQRSRDVSSFNSDTTTEVVGVVVVELHSAPEAGIPKQSRPVWHGTREGEEQRIYDANYISGRSVLVLGVG